MKHFIIPFLHKFHPWFISLSNINKKNTLEIRSKTSTINATYYYKTWVLNLAFYIIVIIFFFLFLSIIGLSDNDLAFANKDNSTSQKNIDICCTWGDSINDGELTFSIKDGGSDLAKIVKRAINDWENP